MKNKNNNKNNLNPYHKNENYSLEINKAKNKYIATSDKSISTNTHKLKKINLNIDRQRSPNLKKTAFNKYFNKNPITENSKNNNNNNNRNNNLKKINIATKTKKSNTKYSTFLSNKKKLLDKNHSYSNEFRELPKVNLDIRKKINNTNIKRNNYTHNYQTNQPQYIIHKNIDLNNDIDPRQEYEDLITDQIDDINMQEKYLTDDKNLISKFQGLANDNTGKQIYKPVLENIIQNKMHYLNQLQDNIVEYKKLLHKYK
jgi:hypothetical protein